LCGDHRDLEDLTVISSTVLRRVEEPASVLPAAPHSPDATGLDFAFLVELLAKVLFIRGQMRLAELVDHVKLLPSVLGPVVEFMRAEKLCEVVRRGESEGATIFALTDVGRIRAEDFRRRSQYAGPAPVSLEAYVQQVQSQAVGNMGVTREHLQRAFTGIVVKEALLEQFGAAMNSGRAIFIYGPAGSGKTYIAERLVGLLSGAIAVPHAIAVGGEVIQVFDPLVHEPVRHTGVTSASLDRGAAKDARWQLCRRPVVMTGAELTLAMVDLDFDDRTRFYHAPPQVKANNGLFIIDDLGRQLVSAQDLMNRWIVPLDRRIDYLALHTGQKFMVPFDVIVVFSSNLPPAELLVDEAFLRRLGYKIYMGALEPAAYTAIFHQVCGQFGIPLSEAGVSHLLERHRIERRPLLACLPRDILGQLRDQARFNGVEPEMSEERLDWAWNNYFVKKGTSLQGDAEDSANSKLERGTK
jgi:hypothetical protein